MISLRNKNVWGRLIVLIGVTLAVFWFLLARAYQPHLGSLRANHITGQKSRWSREEFINAAVATVVEDDFDYSAISEVCHSRPWDENIVFRCKDIEGGIGNIKQIYLSCVRYAIEAGAGLLMPSIFQRAQGDLANLKSKVVPIDRIFDYQRFMSRMEVACPRMHIYKDLATLQEFGTVKETRELRLWDTFQVQGFPVTNIERQVANLKSAEAQISLIPFGMTMQYYPICRDSESFADNFGQLLPLRADVHRLAASVLHSITTRFQLPIDPTVLISHPKVALFLGVHLRSASDALPNWPTYEEQATHHLRTIHSFLQEAHIPAIYIASGNLSSTKDFSARVHDLDDHIPTLTKFDLLAGEDLKALEALSWDQQALVDYLVLLRSSFFMGMAESSFAFSVAVKRRTLTRAGSCGVRKGIWTGYLLGSAFRDEFSDLLLWRPLGWEYKMWP